MDKPWLSIIGLGEDGLSDRHSTIRRCIDQADTVFGGPRHLDLAGVGDRGVPWPVPFDLSNVFRRRGQPTVVLASGDPFFFGVGTQLAKKLAPHEWQAFPSPSTFSLIASELGWPLEQVQCFGLHGRDRRTTSAPFTVDTSRVFGELLPHLYPGNRWICLLRDAASVKAMGVWLGEQGFGASHLWLMEAIGGSRQRVRQQKADHIEIETGQLPLSVAVELVGATGFSTAPGRPESAFFHDGQISKATVRALTITALAPRPHEQLWDIGAGSGAISVEWCLAGGGTSVAIELRPDRAENIRKNVRRYGLQPRIDVRVGAVPTALASLPSPHAIFVGGGMSKELFHELQPYLRSKARMVVNAVTVETEQLLMDLHHTYGGDIYQFSHATLQPLGTKRGWSPSRPIVQWRSELRE